MSDFVSIADAEMEIDAINEWLMHAGDELTRLDDEGEIEKMRQTIRLAEECRHAAEVWIETRN